MSTDLPSDWTAACPETSSRSSVFTPRPRAPTVIRWSADTRVTSSRPTSSRASITTRCCRKSWISSRTWRGQGSVWWETASCRASTRRRKWPRSLQDATTPSWGLWWVTFSYLIDQLFPVVVNFIKLFWRKSRIPLKGETARIGHFNSNKQF